MGRLNNTPKIFTDITNIKQDMNYSDYSKELETKPIITTYYNQNLVQSTADSGLQAVNKLIGDGSPLHFNKINKLPLYSVPLTNLGLNFDEKGPHIDFEGDGVIPPGIIEPKPNDFFSIDYLGVEYLFKVTNVDFDTIRSNNYYKISFHFSKNNNGDIDKNVTENSTVIYDDIGSKSNKCIMLDDDYAECNNLMSLSDDIIKLLCTKFWDNTLCYFIFNKNVYDPWLNLFIKEEKLLKDDSYDNEIYIQNPCVVDVDNFLYQYETSYFKLLKSGAKELLPNNNYVILQDVSKRTGNPFIMTRKHYKDDAIYEVKPLYLEKGFDRRLIVSSVNLFDIEDAIFKPSLYIDKDLVENIMNNTLFDKPTPIQDMENTIVNKFNNNEKETYIQLKNKFDKYKVSHDFEPSFTTFVTLFSFLFVVRENINTLRKK